MFFIAIRLSLISFIIFYYLNVVYFELTDTLRVVHVICCTILCSVEKTGPIMLSQDVFADFTKLNAKFYQIDIKAKREIVLKQKSFFSPCIWQQGL